jgi:thiamine biosynthesis lipoprotein
LLAIDGEVRAIGVQPDGSPWVVAVERPDYDSRAVQSVIGLQDAAIATSGDYRHWVVLGARWLSHTMDPRRGGLLEASPASVRVVAGRCMEADAWATALMVRGSIAGAALARQNGLNAVFMDRRGDGFVMTPVGPLFEAGADPERVA